MNYYRLYPITEKSVSDLSEEMKEKFGDKINWDKSPRINSVDKSIEFIFENKEDLKSIPKFAISGVCEDRISTLSVQRLLKINDYSFFKGIGSNTFSDEEDRARMIDGVFIVNFYNKKEYTYGDSIVNLGDIIGDLEKRSRNWRNIFINNTLVAYLSVDENKKIFEDFMQTMGEYTSHKDKYDKTLKEVFSDVGDYDEDFVKWFINYRGVSEHQLRCEHNRTDSWSLDGHFYNSIDECTKCGLKECDDIFDSCDHELIEDMFEAWKAGKNGKN